MGIDTKTLPRLGFEGLFIVGVLSVADAYILPPQAQFSLIGLASKGAVAGAGLLLIDMYHKKMYPDGKHPMWGL